MTRIMAYCVVVASLCVAASAGVSAGSISGYVKNSAGVPQMGATVEVLSSAGQPQVAYTDAKGFFSLSGLAAGTYDVDVSAPSFLSTLRQDVVLAAGSSKVINITLKTLLEAVSMLPPLKKSDADDDSWRWTLRSTANRPVLRFDGDTALIVETEQEGQPLKGTLALMAGAAGEGYGSAATLEPPSTSSSRSSTPEPWDLPVTWDTEVVCPTAWFARPTPATPLTETSLSL
jgi:hypothetical protein